MEIQSYIDYTNLKPTATENDIISLCNTALENNFKAVCVAPYNIGIAEKVLFNSPVKIATVVGFPLGANSLRAKLFEAQDALLAGANEIDFVINIGALLQGNEDYITNEIAQMKKVCGDHTLKVIVETCYLDDAHLEIACRACLNGGADFIKTSTGFGTAGASVEVVEKIRKLTANKINIKASGGIKTKADAINLIKAGAKRIGTSTNLNE